MTSHSDKPAQEILAGKFPTSSFSLLILPSLPSLSLSPHLSHSCCSCFFPSFHCLVEITLCLSPVITHPSNHASPLFVTHVRPPSLPSLAPYIIHHFQKWVNIFTSLDFLFLSIFLLSIYHYYFYYYYLYYHSIIFSPRILFVHRWETEQAVP